MTPEGRVKQAIKAVLARHGAYWHMPVQNGMGAPSLDFVVCHKGSFIGVEAKAPGGKPTARQRHTMQRISAAGGETLCVSSEEDLVQLDGVLSGLGNGRSRRGP